MSSLPLPATSTDSPPPRTSGAAARIHVLQVLGNAIVGGMECWVERLIERLPAERFAITALLPYEGPFAQRLRRFGIEVFVTPMPEDPSWASIQMATALVHSSGIDLLHAHLPNAHMLAALAGRLAGRPVMTTIHGRQLALVDLELHRSAGSHLSVVCQQTYFHALGLGVNAALLSHDPNGVDCAVFAPRERPRGEASLRARLGLPEDTPMLGFIGRLSPEKGPELFVRSMLPLLARLPQAHAVMAGDGPMGPAIRRQIAQLRLGRKIHLLGLQQDMPKLYSELDLVVSSSHSEAMPLNLMEAMASGLPVVATRVGGVPDIVEHGHGGWLVAPNNCEDLGARCTELLGDGEMRARFGESARSRSVERLDLDRSIERISELFTQLARSTVIEKAGGELHGVSARAAR